MGRAGARRRARADDGDLGLAVTRARGGDEAAFGSVYREVQPMLLGYLRGLVGDDADDVASDAWHDIVRDFGAFRGDGAAFRGWAATIARHRALDHLRRIKSRPRTTALDPAAAEPAPAPDSAGVALENLSTARALTMIAALPQDQAEAVLLRVVIGLSGPAAAKVLGKRPGAVRTASYRGLRRLAQQLGGGPVPGDGPAPESADGPVPGDGDSRVPGGGAPVSGEGDGDGEGPAPGDGGGRVPGGGAPVSGEGDGEGPVPGDGEGRVPGGGAPVSGEGDGEGPVPGDGFGSGFGGESDSGSAAPDDDAGEG